MCLRAMKRDMRNLEPCLQVGVGREGDWREGYGCPDKVGSPVTEN